MLRKVNKKAVIIGGGPAGLAAACALKKSGIDDIVILEREAQLGGILRQCIHDGFGLVRFAQTLSGPEYAQKFIDEVRALGIEYVTHTTVIDLTPDRKVTAVSSCGITEYHADAVVLAMGCRERTRGALAIPGARPSGVYTAGVAQAYINLKNRMIGKNAVILGSGDIGLIMARRLTLEGVNVHGVFEINPYPSGLSRNIEQCLNDYNIPLHTSHTVTQIKGKARLESVVVSRVDESLSPIPGTEKEIFCDTLILSVGLIPENELSLKAGVDIDPKTSGPVVDEFCRTNVPGIFAAGNVLHVHDLADYVSLEAEHLAQGICKLFSGDLPVCETEVTNGHGIANVVPQTISGANDVKLYFRASKPVRNAVVSVVQKGEKLKSCRYNKLLPAEMNSIVVPGEKIKTKDKLQVVVEC